MRIVIDLQGAQSGGSRNRGIGRYSLSLALAIARNRGEHEVLIALSAFYPNAVEAIREEFAGVLPAANIRVWGAVGPIGMLDENNRWRTKSAEIAREAFLASLRPDVIHVSSVFEGLMDDVATSLREDSRGILTSVTLYDLIPYIHRDEYIGDKKVADWYFSKLDNFRRADLWLAISESSRREGIECLGLPGDRVVNVSADADPRFEKVGVSGEVECSIRERYGLTKGFVMCSGGYDSRKNIDGLIKAFSLLPAEVLRTHQLAVVCSVPSEDIGALRRVARNHGLSDEDVVFTGFVSNEDLVALYVLCSLFVFPSRHEGFGLPVLEAMRCGAPVIAANNSSIPEVVGWEEALFDQESPEAIMECMKKALTEDAFRSELVRRGSEQSKNFSWDKSAVIAICSMEKAFSEFETKRERYSSGGSRHRLAYVSSAKKINTVQESGQELLLQLSRFYDVDLFVDDVAGWHGSDYFAGGLECFSENYGKYDRVIYHFWSGGSCRKLLELLEDVPGVVIMNDLFVFKGSDSQFDEAAEGEAARDLYRSHGYFAVLDGVSASTISGAYDKYPCSLDVVRRGLGVIVHSKEMVSLAERLYGGEILDWDVLPFVSDLQFRSRSGCDEAGSMCGVRDSVDNTSLVSNANYVGEKSQCHNPCLLVEKYVDSVEGFYRWSRLDFTGLPARVASLGMPADNGELVRYSDAVASCIPVRNRGRQLLVDVSTLIHYDSRSGVQRVVRSILKEWLTNPPEGVRVEPVYALTGFSGYRYARAFTLKFIGCEVGSIVDDWVEYASGDVFLGLDLQHHVVVSQQATFERMRSSGVNVRFVVYDLLPIMLPHVFRPGVDQLHDAWIRVVAKSDGAVCISKSVADELSCWLQENTPERHKKFAVDWFHLGGDVNGSLPSMGLPEDSDAVLSSIGRATSFLMVGTIEPRKGHAQVLDAFELLWRADRDVNLVIVGNQGWLVEKLVEIIRSHPERGCRLFWFEGVSDEFLEKLYDACTCLIAASYGEGFGLPLIEAAQHGLPILARDIPVFREVADKHACYFSADSGEELARAIDGWICAHKNNDYPDSKGLPWLTWRESAGQLSSKLINASVSAAGG